jgi:type II secretory pathway predicted ATPase ExeA
MIQQYFGLKHIPLAKNGPFLMENPSFCVLKERFHRLLEHPGIGLLTGEAGVGKTACLRHLCASLNPHQYEVIYLAETQFSRFDVYRQIAQNFGLDPHYRFAQLWRDIKNHIRERVENKSSMPILILDESQNLPLSFFQSLPSFLNFNFDSQDMLIVWLVGHPELVHILNRQAYVALSSRIQVRHQLEAVDEREAFSKLISQAFKEAGATASLLSGSGIELLRTASGGKPRYAHRILTESFALAAKNGLNHLPDEVIETAILQIKEG